MNLRAALACLFVLATTTAAWPQTKLLEKRESLYNNIFVYGDASTDRLQRSERLRRRAEFPGREGRVVRAINQGIGLPRMSEARSIFTSTPMPVSAPTWVCSRGSSSLKIAA